MPERAFRFGEPFDQGLAGADSNAFLSAVLHFDAALFSEPAQLDGVLPSGFVIQLKRQHLLGGQKPKRFRLAASSHD
ncbi:hypothetical protein D3C72_1948780 [compost metagenome]